jgi:chemotaxis response regulator CheB
VQQASVLIAHDDPCLRSALRDAIGEQPRLIVAAEAADGERATAMALRVRPDVVLIDPELPVRVGLTALQAITALVSRRRATPFFAGW